MATVRHVAGDLLNVEVVFALPDRQALKPLAVRPGTTVAQAIDQSAIALEFPDRDLRMAPVAIWGKTARRDEQLRDGDRIEILRPLEIDPRDARRELASKGQFMGGSGSGGPADSG